MKLVLNKNQIDTTPEQFLRQAGYSYHRDRKTGEESFTRRLGSGFYPRLHIYVQEQGEQVGFNLHLDQKQASYAGAHKHNAEYGGEVVEKEIGRLKSLVQKTGNIEQKSSNNEQQTEIVKDKIGHGELPKGGVKEKKSWWKRLFL